MNKYYLYKNVIASNFKIFCKIRTHQRLVRWHSTIRRAVLYVPGSDIQKLKKAFQLKVDCIVMDCEDGVALNQKEEARNNIKKLLDEGNVTVSDPEWSVRVNPVQTPELFEADIDTILSAKNLPITICLPKFSEKIWNALIKRPEGDRGPIKLMMLIESAIAIVNLPELCKKAQDLSSMAPIIPVSLILGGDDLLASIGGRKTPTEIQLLYARQKMVLVAKAFGLQAIDVVFLNYNDHTNFQKSCQDGVILGYNGKQVIHPNQVVIAQDEFVPSRSQIYRAKNIIKAFKENQEKGKGAFTFENEMIDMPTIRQAENILKIAAATGKLEGSADSHNL